MTFLTLQALPHRALEEVPSSLCCQQWCCCCLCCTVWSHRWRANICHQEHVAPPSWDDKMLTFHGSTRVAADAIPRHGAAQKWIHLSLTLWKSAQEKNTWEQNRYARTFFFAGLPLIKMLEVSHTPSCRENISEFALSDVHLGF